MVQSSEFSQATLQHRLEQALGVTLTAADLAYCLKHLQRLELPSAKKFWSSSNTESGIFVILSGKARLFDRADQFIASLDSSMELGALTLFPDEGFQIQSAKASLNLSVGFLSAEHLAFLMRQHPAIQTHLHQQAMLWDLVVLCRQIDALREVPLENLMTVLLRLKHHELKPGSLPKALCNQKLWFVRRGELRHSAGQTITAGQFFSPQSLLGSWQAAQLTDLYCLDADEWGAAQLSLPQLVELIPAATKQQCEQQCERRSYQKSILSPFPKPSRSNHQKRIHRAYFPNPTLRLGHVWQRTIRRYPFFQQQSTSDCGAACLVMIGRYWGKRFSVNRLRDLANVDRNGATLRGLATTAESLGFSARPVKASLDKLAEQSLPAIVHWEGKHYIVVYEVTRDRVIVADPALGQQSLTHKAFKAGWTGYTLLIQPTFSLKDAEEAKQPFWQFLELVKPHWLVLIEIFIASVLIQVFGLVTPWFTQLILDRVVVQRSELTLTTVGLGLLMFSLFRVAITGLRQYLLDHTANRVDSALIAGFIRHTFQLPLSFFESRYVGDIISRIQENRKIQRFLTGEALSIFLDLLTVFIYLGLMFWYNWQMALLTLVIVPPFVLLAFIATPFLQRVSRRIFGAVNEETGYLIQALNGVRTVKSMAVEQSVRWHWEDLFNRSAKRNFSGQVIHNALQVMSATIEVTATTLLLWFGAWQVIQNNLTIGQLVAFNMLLGNVMNPFKRLMVLWNELQEVVIAVERINDVIDTEPEEDLQHQSRQVLPRMRGEVQFEAVTFRYHPESETNTLENLSFLVLPGQTVALVGRSGSGKTTISKLLLGLYPSTHGKVLIDGYDITQLSLRSLRQQIGVVDQDTFMFGGTIRENISIGHPSTSLEDVIEAAKQAGAHSFIQALPMGYETQIGEGGGMLSGGQRQRLAIARALIGNPSMLIMDEATSHLDTESERIIQTNLGSISRNRTTFIIAHRLSTIRHADLILVLDRGVLIESGSHDELMAKRGQYFYLNQQQLLAVG